MALIDMITDISSFDYGKVGKKHGEYFGEDKATGFTPNRQTKNPTEYVENQITGLGTTDYFTPNYNPLEDQSGFTPTFVNYFEDIHQTGFTTPEFKVSNFTDQSGFTPTFVDYFDNTHQSGFITPIFKVSNFVDQSGFIPTAVNYFSDVNATGYTLDRTTKDIGTDSETFAGEYKIGTSLYGELGTTNMIDVNSKFTSGNFVTDMELKNSDLDTSESNLVENLITVNYPRLQGARQGDATNKPNQGDFGSNHPYGVDGEDGKFHSELRLRAETPGFWARLAGKTDDVSAMYEFKGGMAKALRDPDNFGFTEPFIVHDIGNGYASLGLDEGIFRGGAALNVVRSAEDAIRFAKWSLTGRGIIWNLKQFVLQAQNPISANRIFNPLGPIGSILPGVHLPRHTNGTFLDVNDPPSYSTQEDGNNILMPEEEEEGGLLGALGGALSSLGIGGARKTNRLAQLHKSRIIDGGGEPQSGFSILGSLGLGNNEFEDPQRKVNSTKGPFGGEIPDSKGRIVKHKDLKEKYRKQPFGQSDVRLSGGLAANPELDVVNEEYETIMNTNVTFDSYDNEEEVVKGAFNYNLGRGNIKHRNGLFSVGVSNQLQVPYGGQFDKLNASVEELPKDFIKFRIRDAVNGKWLIFPAHLGSVSDTVTANWTGEKYIGRPDSVHLYTGTDRAVSFDFKVAAFTKQEIPIIQEKMNYLMGLGYPTFKKILSSDDEERPVAPYVYLTIGDLFNNTPGFFTSIAITMEEGVTWEIDEGFQIPQVFSVAVEFTHVGKYLPHTLGKHYEVPWLKDSGVGNGKFGTFETDPRDGTTSRPKVHGTQGWSDGVLPHKGL